MGAMWVPRLVWCVVWYGAVRRQGGQLAPSRVTNSLKGWRLVLLKAVHLSLVQRNCLSGQLSNQLYRPASFAGALATA